jgi:hypothetical protein
VHQNVTIPMVEDFADAIEGKSALLASGADSEGKTQPSPWPSCRSPLSSAMMRSLMGTGRRALRDFHHNAVSPDNASSRLVNLQGVRMGRPGRIYISLSSRAGVLEEVRVGGEAVVVGEGTVLD